MLLLRTAIAFRSPLLERLDAINGPSKDVTGKSIAWLILHERGDDGRTLSSWGKLHQVDRAGSVRGRD